MILSTPFYIPHVGAIGGLFIVAVLVFLALIHRKKRKMREFFKKNGGPILEKVNNIKIFKKEELKPILKLKLAILLEKVDSVRFTKAVLLITNWWP